MSDPKFDGEPNNCFRVTNRTRVVSLGLHPSGQKRGNAADPLTCHTLAGEAVRPLLASSLHKWRVGDWGGTDGETCCEPAMGLAQLGISLDLELESEGLFGGFVGLQDRVTTMWPCENCFCENRPCGLTCTGPATQRSSSKESFFSLGQRQMRGCCESCH